VDYQRIDTNNDWHGLYVAVPWGEQPHIRVQRVLQRMLVWAMASDLRATIKDYAGKSGVADAHNHLIRNFLMTDYEWMLMMDSDCIITPLHIERMASWQAPVVSALIFRSKPPYAPTIYRTRGDPGWLNEFEWIREWLSEHLDQLGIIDHAPVIQAPRRNPLHTIAQAGTHCMLVHRSVFLDIGPPWFEATFESGAGSDFNFVEKAQEAAYDVMVDLSAIAGHLEGSYCTGPIDWLVWDNHCEYDNEEERLSIRIYADE